MHGGKSGAEEFAAVRELARSIEGGLWKKGGRRENIT